MRVAVWLVCTACGRIGFDTVPDAVSDDAPVGPLGPWSQPVAVVTQSPPLDDPSLTADELELYVNLDLEVNVLRRASRTDPWGPLEPLSLASDATQPFVSADGLTLYMTDFTRVRISTRATRADVWSAPVVDASLNTPTNGTDAGPRNDELELVVSLADGTDSLALVRRASRADAWGPREPLALGVIATEGCLAERGLALYFSSFQGTAGLDIYRSERAALDQPFGAATPITELNTSFEDSDPWVSDDGRRMYFTTTRGTDGEREIWMTTR